MEIRKRKTKIPCENCGLHLNLCICSKIHKLDLPTKLSLVIHNRELKRTTNTGQLALLALTNSSKYIVGDKSFPFKLESILSTEYENLLFYPSEDSVELNTSLIQSFNKPVHLIVPDGNWRQASKIHYKNKNLTQLRRVKISTQHHSSKYFLRKETKPNGMATLEAIAHAFNILEGQKVMDELMTIYNYKLKNTLIGRGISVKDIFCNLK